MRLVLTIALVLSLIGCQSVPVAPKFPDIPESLNESCPELSLAKDSDKLSDLLSTVATNYGKYHECSARIEAWKEWYKSQKENYNSIK